MMFEQRFLVSLVQTIAIELPTVYVVLRVFYKIPKTTPILFVALIANTLTLPYLWFVLPAFLHERVLFLLFGEVAVTVAEAVLYRRLLKITSTQALVASCIANALSALAGFVGFH
jgi:hypothetical protein